MALTLFSNDLYKTHWICKVKSILDNCGLSYMWENQCTLDNSTCKNIIFSRIEWLHVTSSLCAVTILEIEICKQWLHFYFLFPT